MKSGSEVIEVNFGELAALLERARQGPLGEEDCQRLEAAIDALSYLIEKIGEKNTTISQLRALLTKPSTEKTSKVLEQAGIKTPPKNSSPPHANEPKKPKRGHGRNGAISYGGARRIKIAHASLKPGDRCPECLKGKVYEQKDPALRIRVVGQAPIAATVYELDRLRCNLCGEVFKAEAPEGVGEKKYDET
ncbi:MAG: IS66 family transposase, partial [Acidobacteriia bacterium]|nr:IS66 family transposase [Terriglobia bacterium]